MATVSQVTELYRKILDYLMPLERGILGWGENRFFGNGGDFDSAYSRSDNGRFFYTGLGSGQPLGGYVRVESEKIRGDWFTREVGGGVLGVGVMRTVDAVSGVGGVLSGDSISGIGYAGYMRAADDVGRMLGMRDKHGAWRNWSTWNVGNDRNWGMESTSRALTGANAVNALSPLNAMSAANTASKQNALKFRLGEDLEKQLNGKRILGANFLAPIDRSLEITGRGFSAIGGISELWGDQNGFSQNRKKSGTLGTQSAVSEKIRSGGSERMRKAVSPKLTAANAISSFEESAERTEAIRGFVGRDGSETARLEAAGGYDTDELIDRLCGAFREAAFSMSEGVHY